MPFKYKLSKRLALMKAATVAAAVMACERQPTDPALTILSVTQVTTSPSSITVDPESTRVFRAFGRTPAGDSVGVPVTWSASGGSISGDGVYTAGPVAGDFTVTATITGTQKTGTSVIRNRGSLAGLVMTPASVSLMPGQTTQMLVYGVRQNGDSVPVTVTFTATGGTVSAFGLYTAGAAGGTYRVVAKQQGGPLADTTSVAITTGLPTPVATVTVSPASVTLAPGATRQLTAVTTDAAGNTLSGRAVTWTSSNGSVATVNGSGLVSAAAAGSTTITVSSEGKSGTSAVTVPAVAHAGFYVSATGSASGSGSATSPWDLQTALNQPAAVHPGDTIWVRGGTYQGQFTSRLNGTASSPIIVRQYPGERATIDGGSGGAPLTTSGSYTWFWGFEVMKSNPAAGSGMGINVYNSVADRFINLVIHDASKSGIGHFSLNGARQTVIHGSLSYNNGHEFNLDHGMYLQNAPGTGTVEVSDNIVFNNLGFGIHVYGQSPEAISGFLIEGNVVFGNGSISVPVNRGNEILIGGAVPASAIVARNNYTYWPVAPGSDPGRWSMNLGYTGGVQNSDLVAENNYVVGGLYLGRWSTASVRGNAIYDFAGPMVTTESASGQTWTGNQFYGTATLPVWTALPNATTTFATWLGQTGFAAPGTYGSVLPPNLVVVRPNQYEAGRANIIVYNWTLQSSVSVDLSGVLQPGDRYVVQNAQDFFGAPAASGTYTGGTIALSQTGITPVAPLARSYTPAPITGPVFQVFVVMVVN